MHSPMQDISAGLRSWRFALHWAWMDTKLKYRRSVIGPLWITISVGATILGMDVWRDSHRLKRELGFLPDVPAMYEDLRAPSCWTSWPICRERNHGCGTSCATS